MSEELVVDDHGKRWQMTLHVDGQAVSGTGMQKMRMRVAGTDVKMGGIAGVWTDEAHRYKGYASRVMHAANDYMAARSCDVAILFGIRDFYHRYGYGVAFRDSALNVRTEALAEVCAQLPARTATKTDLELIRRLSTRCQAGRSGTAVRNGRPNTAHAPGPKGWRMPRMGEGTVRRPGKALVVGAPGHVEGYVVYDIQGAQCAVTEAGARDRQTYDSMVAALVRRAKRTDIDAIRFYLPPDDPFVEYLFRFGASLSTSQHANAGCMGRVLRLKPLLEKVAGGWNRSRVSGDPARPVTLETDIGTVTISGGDPVCILEGKLPGAYVVKLWQAHLLQLLMGHRSVDDLATDPGATMPKAAVAPLRELFPTGHPYMHWADRF